MTEPKKRGRPPKTEEQRARERQAKVLAEHREQSPEYRLLVERGMRALLAAQEDSPFGFSNFYFAIHGRELPPHCRRWVRQMYVSHHKHKKGLVVEAFRGSTKTTAMTITFTAWRMGWQPSDAFLLIQVGDDTAADNTAAIADIIKNNPFWKIAFPNVAPDEAKGWGAGGYEVLRTDMPYEAWRALNAARKDPSLLGVGYKSGEIIGRHPTGMLIIDDIHDEKNTASARELRSVMNILKGTIFPTLSKGGWKLFIGTPWRKNDVLHYVLATGRYDHCHTPVYRDLPDGRRLYAWPSEFDEAQIEEKRYLSGPTEFARMYLLDLKAAENKVIKYSAYPNSEIRFNWPMVGGVDYASNKDAAKNAEGKGDWFAMAYVAKLPGGGAVVVGGVLEHLTQAQGEAHVKRAQEVFPMWLHSGVEAVGKGDDFAQLLMRNPGLRFVPYHTGTRSKVSRIEKEMGPWLENGMVRISDAEDPFLSELRDELDAFPFHEHDDAMDAVYWALRSMPDVLVIREEKSELATTEPANKQSKSPFAAFGRH